ncbi:GNAT family N-acetyltransferase [Candidatus Gracilibacteria bacterium]|nr:GNAT family N-acetyltransferase [Candidatus Gracilibacteria bacterium]
MLELVSPDISYKKQWEGIIQEWDNSRKRPWIFFQDSYEIFLEKIALPSISDDAINQISKSSFFFLQEIESKKIVGFYWLRHNLKFWDDDVYGGQIGYGIRPSERQKGYGKEGLNLLLTEAKKLGFDKVFIACDDDNIPSAKIIEANGGVLEKYTKRDEVKGRRYWINLK